MTSQDVDQASDFLKTWQWKKQLMPLNGKSPRHDLTYEMRGTYQWKYHPRGWLNEYPTAEEVLAFAEAGAGIGLFTGSVSGVIDLEIDNLDLFREIPEAYQILESIVTPTADSTKGPHFFFNAKSQNPNISVVRNGVVVVELHGDGRYVAVPPSRGKRWRDGRSVWDVALAELPNQILSILVSLSSDDATIDSIKGNGQTSIKGDGTPSITGNSPIMDTLLNPTDSPLVREVVWRLGGVGLRVLCPYHPPDGKPSARFYCNNGQWVMRDFHPPQATYPIQQVVCDMLTGYPVTKRSRHWIRVGRLQDGDFVPAQPWRFKPEAYVWLALFAGEAGLIELPVVSTALNLDPADWQDAELRLLRFVFRWFPANKYVFKSDEVPLARPWLCSVLDLDDKTVDRTLAKARRRGILVRVQQGTKGYGGRPALYQIGDSQ